MEELFCFRCRKSSEHSEYDPCPHCGGRGPWDRSKNGPLRSFNPDNWKWPEAEWSMK